MLVRLGLTHIDMKAPQTENLELFFVAENVLLVPDIICKLAAHYDKYITVEDLQETLTISMSLPPSP